MGDPIVCGVAVENEIFKQANNQVSQVRLRVLPLPRSLLLAVCTILQAGTGRRDSTNPQPVGLLSAWHRRRAARAALVPGTRPAWQQAPLCQPSACASPPAAQAYKAKFRNLHFNLKDAANPDLRRKVRPAWEPDMPLRAGQAGDGGACAEPPPGESPPPLLEEFPVPAAAPPPPPHTHTHTPPTPPPPHRPVPRSLH